MPTEFEILANQIEKAGAPEDIFGLLVGTEDEQSRGVTHIYRKLCFVIHPDKFQASPLLNKATFLFGRLNDWKTVAERKIRDNIYGDRNAVPLEKPTDLEPQIINTSTVQYTVKSLLTRGDLTDLYLCDSKPKRGLASEAVFKLVQSAADNDLLENEYLTLSAIYPSKTPEEKFYRYLPKLYNTMLLKGTSGSVRRANVLQYAKEYYSLAEILKAYPKGLDYRDVVWMFKRMLAGLGYIHKHKDVIHGAVLPTHVLVHPTEHGAKLIDWSYSVRDWPKLNGKVKALSKPYKTYYAPEIIAGKPPTPQTDLYMAAKCAVALLGGNVETNRMPRSVPSEVQGFLGSCLLVLQNKRPDDAWALHEEFDALLLRLVGKPTYRRLKMPPR